MVLRTVSNYDREAPGTTPAESLASGRPIGNTAYLAAIEAAEQVGDVVVRDIVGHWAERELAIPSTGRQRMATRRGRCGTAITSIARRSVLLMASARVRP